jgi:acetyltransferase-like isoleucine patch superfamily enzyme
LSLIPGTLGDYLRREFYRLTLDTCGKESVITFGVLLSNPRTRIGENVYIGPYSTIGWADIRNDVLLGANVHVLSGKTQHLAEDVEQPIRLQGNRFERVIIGDDVWVGNGAVVMVNIGRKSIVGAGSVVVTDVEDFSVVAGNPARVLKKRV